MASLSRRKNRGSQLKRQRHRQREAARLSRFRTQIALESLEPRLLLSGYYTSRPEFLADAQIGPTWSIDFDTLPPGSDLTNVTMSGVRFEAPGSGPLLVTPAATGIRYPLTTSTSPNVLSPGGSDTTLENDDLRLVFPAPVRAAGLDVVFDVPDGASSVSVTFLDENGNTLYTQHPIPAPSAGPGYQFVGYVSPVANIKSVVLDEFDAIATDDHVAFDSIVSSDNPVAEHAVDAHTVALYHFNGDAVDAVGNHAAALRGNSAYTVESGGALGMGVSVDGQGDYIRLGNVHQNPARSTSAGSIDMWVNLTATTSGNFELATAGREYGEDYDDGFYLGRYGGSLLFGIWTGNWQWAQSGIDPNSLVGRWHHLAGTWGSRGVELWLDGVLVARNNHTGGMSSSYSTILVGSGSWQWDTPAVIDELRISDSQRDFSGMAALPADIVSRWPMDGSAYDVVGSNNPSASNAISFVPGKAAQAVTFGTGGYIEIPHSASLANQRFTIAAWVRPDGAGPNNDEYGNIIATKVVASGNHSASLLWRATDNRFLFLFGDITSERLISANSFAPGQFYQVAATYDGTRFQLIVNGAIEGAVTLSKTVAYEPSMPWAVGSSVRVFRDLGVPRTWNGLIDDVAIYNRALTAAEIQSLMGGPVIPPAVAGVKPLPRTTAIAPNEGLTGPLTQLGLTFTKSLQATTVNDSGNWELREAGPDTVFNTADDRLVALALAAPYVSGTDISLNLTDGTLTLGRYRFTVIDGALLDLDGTANDEFTLDFRAIPPPVNEIEPNNELAAATPLQLYEDPVGSGLWTSGVAVGTISPQGDGDYWSFPARQGDQLVINLESAGLPYPLFYVYNAAGQQLFNSSSWSSDGFGTRARQRTRSIRFRQPVRTTSWPPTITAAITRAPINCELTWVAEYNWSRTTPISPTTALVVRMRWDLMWAKRDNCRRVWRDRCIRKKESTTTRWGDSTPGTRLT